MTTLEKVEKLCSMGDITFEEAKASLEAVDGDLLEAIIELEKQGKIHAPAGGYYSSEKTGGAQAISCQAKDWQQQPGGDKESPFLSFFKDAGYFFLKLLRKGNANSFEVLKGEAVKGAFPITVLVLLLLFAFWVTLPLLIIGLFFGFRYRFVGADIKGATINDAMDSAADAAENLKKSLDK